MTRTWVGAVVAAALLTVPGPSAWAQQRRLDAAKGLYIAADYEEALKLLAGLTADEAPADEAHHYRALCLLALGRADEAEDAAGAAVEANPFFVPAPTEVSPRVGRMYADVRQERLPRIARRRLIEARERHLDGERQRALEGFDAVLKILSDPAMVAREDLADLRLAAEGLAELARTQSEAAASRAAAVANASGPPVAPPSVQGPSPGSGVGGAPPPIALPAPTPVVALVPAASEPATTSDNSARPSLVSAPGPSPAAAAYTTPVALSQTLPRWMPPDSNLARRSFSGAIRVSVDAAGAVTSARMERSVFPRYDRLLLEAARTWRYRPATRAGVPVDGEVVVEVQLRPER